MNIALDLAGRICSGELKVGHRVFGRSTLASEYSVSPETIRRAVNLLEDMQVVSHVTGQRNLYILSEQRLFVCSEISEQGHHPFSKK